MSSLSLNKSYIYIHIYKTGGTSVIEALSNWDELKKPLPIRVLRKIKRTLTGGVHITDDRQHPIKMLSSLNEWNSGHLVIKEFQAILPVDIYSNLFKFCFVRNPWSLQVSLYNYMRTNKKHFFNKDASSFKSFDEYIRWRVDREVRLQISFILDYEENIGVNYIGRFETLRQDMTKILAHLKLPAVSLNESNRSTFDDWRSYYNDRTAALVAKAYARDIETFGYEFDAFSNTSAFERNSAI